MSWEDEDLDNRLDRLDRQFKSAGFSDEDDDDDVKDAWDADSDDEKEKKDAAKPAAAAAPAKTKKKTIKQIAAEKEAKAKEEAEARRKAHDAARGAHEGEAIGDLEAEKARRQRLVEEADLENAKDLFDDGKPVAKKGEVVPIESMQPKTRADFEAFATAISDKLTQFENAPLYAHCLDMLFKESVTNLHYEDIRKLSAALNVIANQKQTAEKAKKAGGAKKKKGAVIQKVGRDDAADQITAGRHDDLYDDFM